MKNLKSPKKTNAELLRNAVNLEFKNRARLVDYSKDSPPGMDPDFAVESSISEIISASHNALQDPVSKLDFESARKMRAKLAKIIESTDEKIRKAIMPSETLARTFKGSCLEFSSNQKSLFGEDNFHWRPLPKSREKDPDTDWILRAFFCLHGCYELKVNRKDVYRSPSMSATTRLLINFFDSMANFYSTLKISESYSVPTLNERIRNNAKKFISSINKHDLDPLLRRGIELYSADYLQPNRMPVKRIKPKTTNRS